MYQSRSFYISDAAYGELPARKVNKGNFSYDDIRPGDILCIDNGFHSVIVLEVNSDHVVIAEGNYNGKIHWGRTLSKSTVMNAEYIITRYPE